MFGFRRWLTRPLRYAIHRLIQEISMNQADAIVALNSATTSLNAAATRIASTIAAGAGSTTPEFDAALTGLQTAVSGIAAIVPVPVDVPVDPAPQA